MDKYVLDGDAHQRLHLELEGVLFRWCKDHQISGELAWLATKTYAEAKMRMLRDNRL